MKFIIISVVLLTCSIYSASSQLYIGAMGGINNSSFSGAPPKNAGYSSKLGLDAGLTLDVFLSDDFAISLQPGFAQKGSEIVFSNFFNEEKIDSTFQIRGEYYSLPILFKFFAASKNVYFTGGISLNSLNSFTSEDGNGNVNDVSHFFVDYDVSMIFGIAFNLPIDNFNIFLEGRYSQGFVNINNSNELGGDSQEAVYIADFKNTGVSIILGFNFRLLDY